MRATESTGTPSTGARPRERTAATAEDLRGNAGGRLETGPHLQKLLLRSLSDMLVGLRKVTERNVSRKTAGVDGEVAVTSRDRAMLATWIHRSSVPGKPCRSDGCAYRRATESSAHPASP
ncbi:reverse transcriptase N-terminal domain-containing protein [Rhodococcus koreensis]